MYFHRLEDEFDHVKDPTTRCLVIDKAIEIVTATVGSAGDDKATLSADRPSGELMYDLQTQKAAILFGQWLAEHHPKPVAKPVSKPRARKKVSQSKH